MWWLSLWVLLQLLFCVPKTSMSKGHCFAFYLKRTSKWRKAIRTRQSGGKGHGEKSAPEHLLGAFGHFLTEFSALCCEDPYYLIPILVSPFSGLREECWWSRSPSSSAFAPSSIWLWTLLKTDKVDGEGAKGSQSWWGWVPWRFLFPPCCFSLSFCGSW